MDETSDFKARPPVAIDPIGTSSESASVYQLIRDAIIDGRLKPNERLVAADLARRHGTSTNPVREALQLLRGEGFVIFALNRGARVRPIDQDFVRDISEIGVLIEPALTRWFVGMATEEDIAELERLQGLIEENNFADPQRHSELDTAFHTVMYQRHYNRHAAALWWKHREVSARRQSPLQLHARPSRHRDTRASRTHPPHQGPGRRQGGRNHCPPCRRVRPAHSRTNARPQRRPCGLTAHSTPTDQEARAQMKITGVTPWLIQSSSSYWGEFLFVEVTTDAGITGWGEITTTTKLANRALRAMLQQIGAIIIGEDPGNIERLWHKLFRSFTYMGSRGAAVECVSAIDIALWDIRGKALGQPIYELLGGPVRDEIALYTHPDQRKFTTKEGVVQEIKDIVASGHTALKFDPYPYQRGGDEQRDGYLDGQMTRKDEREAAELTALIRETVGPDIEILIDAHGRFDVPTAIRLCRSLEEAGQIDWFEEPVPPESFNALKQVRDKVSAAISWGERGHTKWDFVPILENKLADYIMPDVTWTGGITELKKISALCEAYYIPVSPHDAAGPINVVAGAQVMMTVPNFYKLETSEWNLHKYDPMIDKPLDNSNGSLKLNKTPGLGIEMNRDYLENNRVE